MGLIMAGGIVLVGALAFCAYYLAFAPRWRVRVRAIIATLVVLALGVAALALLLMVRWFDYPLVSWRPFTIAALLALPVVGYVGLGLAGVAVIDLIWRGVGRVRRASASVVPQGSTTADEAADTLPRRLVFLRWATCLVTVAAVGVTGFGYARAHEPAITPVTVTSSQLPPAFDGYRVALLTDLHIGPGLSGEFLRHVVDETNAARPDLIVIAGDVVDGFVAQLSGELTPLSDLRAPDGVLVVTGNREYFAGRPSDWIVAFRSLGLTVLDNNGVTLNRAGATIDVLGIGDRMGPGTTASNLALADRRLRDTVGPRSHFRILAVHEPLQVLADSEGDYVPVDGEGLAATLDVDLALCGHTHGGQMWPVQALVFLQQPVLAGVHDLAGVTTVTSRGVGALGPPVRVGAPPEIPLITLHVAA